ncbi:hypothetical protein ECZU34_58210 [Escherichia coli]|nr:hypothetical protein ECZU34_58210 [Escherichia coli]
MISLSPPTICNSATRRLPAAGREVRRTPREQALPSRSTRTATSTGRAFAAAGRAVGHRHPPAKDNELPDAILTESGLKITPLDAAVPDRAQALIDQTSQLLPRIKITELLMDVDD